MNPFEDMGLSRAISADDSLVSRKGDPILLYSSETMYRKISEHREGMRRSDYFFFVISIRRGEAIQTDEYVPMTVPKRRAREKPFRLSGPKKKSARSTINTVEEVRSERLIVSLIDLSIT